jgi:hypothetical protein
MERRVNGGGPATLLVELRRVPRPWWRRSLLVQLGLVSLGVLGGLAYVLGGRRWFPLLVGQWVVVALQLGLAIAGRPCWRCGRWGRHALLCFRKGGAVADRRH